MQRLPLFLLTIIILASTAFGAPKENLIANGGFEQGLDKWVCWHPEILADKRVALVAEGRDGKQSIVFTGDPEYKQNHLLNLHQINVPLKPDTEYTVSLNIKGVNVKKRPKRRIHLAVRELGKRGKTNKMHYITLTPQEGQWARTTYILKTTPQEAIYYQVIFYVRNLAKGEQLHVDNVAITERDSKVEQQGLATYINSLKKKALARKPVTERIHVFARSQVKYGMGRNYLNWWIDRPLFHDRATRSKHNAPYQVTDASFLKEIDIVKLYGMDGLGSLCVNLGQSANFMRTVDIAEKSGRKDFFVMPEFYGAGKNTDKFFEFYARSVERAAKSQSAYRVNGKIVVGSYIGDGWTPEQLKAFLIRMRKRCGDTFLFVCDVRRTPNVYRWQEGELTVADVTDFQEKLRAYLDVADGIMFAGANHVKEYYTDNNYGSSIGWRYLEEFLYPIYAATAAEPKYAGKLVGLSAGVAYINQRSGDCKRDDRTRTLRKTFEAAMKYRPDFMESPEWNEFNENTCFQPTVARGLSSQRIIRYYMSQIKGEKPTPNPGDDTSIPNLILSYRRVLKIGETLYIELLNVPDSDSTKTYTAQLTLQDMSGKTAHTFPIETFTIREMKARTYKLATEDFAQHRALIPVLKLVNAEGKTITYNDGFRYIRLAATWNTDYLAVKQPLRDVMRGVKYSFKPIGTKVGFQVDAEATAPDLLASAEILEDETEIAAYDRAHEFDRGNVATIQMSVAKYRPVRLTGKIAVRNVSSFTCRSAGNDNLGTTDPGDKEFKFEVKPDGVEVNLFATRASRRLLFTIPRKDVDKAVFDIDLSALKLQLPVSKIVKAGILSKTLKEQYVFHFEHMDTLPDIPVHVNAKSVRFSRSFGSFPSRHDRLYSLRLIGKDGKIFRGRPVLQNNLLWMNPKNIALNLFSASRDRIVSIQIPRHRATSLSYSFDPRHGDLMLPHGDDRRWQAELGGSILYGQPFNRGIPYPRAPVASAPTWVEEDGKTCLKFDGAWQYVTFPPEIIPRGSFTLQFEIKPTSGDNMVLWRCHGQKADGLMMKIRDGKLYGYFRDQRLGGHAFETDLEIKPDEWSTVSASYNLKTLVFKVNGKSSKPYTLTVWSHHTVPATFGGHNKPKYGVIKGDRYFQGFLRAVRVSHYAGGM
jgi:Carbohydrate binding domain/Concanavalin A-like lectin/glucanases superfamily